MDIYLEQDFHKGIRSLQSRFPNQKESIPISLKIRVINSHFHRECSPEAYRIIDKHLTSSPANEIIILEEHESGPELFVYLIPSIKDAINLIASLINLVTAIIKARSEGQKKGDHPYGDPDAQLELVIRSFDNKGKVTEERVLKIYPNESITKNKITKALNNGLKKRLTKVKKST